MSQPLTCHRCGAAADVPEDVTAVTAKCAFCGEQIPLPPDILALRQERIEADQRERVVQTMSAARNAVGKAARGVFWTVMLTTVVPITLAIVGGIVVAIVKAVNASPSDSSSGTNVASSPPAIPVATPPATDPVSTGETHATEVVKALYSHGCKNIVLPPQRMQGDQTLQTKFVVNGTCVRVIAVTGVRANRLTLAMKTPFGEAIQTPPPSSEMDFTYCPKTEGPHPTEITPATDAYYTVAALECPPHLK